MPGEQAGLPFLNLNEMLGTKIHRLTNHAHRCSPLVLAGCPCVARVP